MRIWCLCAARIRSVCIGRGRLHTSNAMCVHTLIYLFAFDLHIRCMLIIIFMVIHVESCRARRDCF